MRGYFWHVAASEVRPDAGNTTKDERERAARMGGRGLNVHIVGERPLGNAVRLTEAPPEAPAPVTRRLRLPKGAAGLYLVMAAFAVVTALLQGWLAINGNAKAELTFLLVLGTTVVILVAAALAATGRERGAAVSLAIGLVVLAFGITLAHEDPAMAVTLPVIGFVVALPHVRGRGLVAFAGVVLVAIAVVGRSSAIARAGIAGEVPLDIMVGGFMAAAILMLFTWRLVRGREDLAERMTRFVEGVPVGIFKTDGDGRLVEANGALVRLLGHADRSELIGRLATDLLHNPLPEGGALADALEVAGTMVGELPLRRADGSPIWVRYHVKAQQDAAGRAIAYEGALEDVSADRAARDADARLVAWKQDRSDILDRLRRLAPGRTVEETADAICVEIAGGGKVAYAAVLELRNGRGATVLADRTGNRRLAAGTPVAQRFAEELRRRAADGPWVESVLARRTDPGYRRLASIGLHQLALVPIEVGDELVGLLLAGSTTATPDLRERLHTLGEFATHTAALIGPALTTRRRRDDLRDQIRDTIERRAFSPVFQPIVDIQTEAVLGYEALTRFHDGTPPDRVFADASSCGMSVELESATISAALDASEPLPANRFIDLNVSPEFVLAEEPLRTHLRQRGFNIVLEITEHVAIEDYGQVRAAIASLGDNVQLAVDDAGAGFASLRHITELRPQFVKLDRALIMDIDSDVIRQALIAGIVHFSESVGSMLIAEGVESEEERQTLLALGVKSAQGYLFGRPTSADLVRR